MQTLKTAIVVLLMMTVAYGCYVSFTGEPEPLPPGIASMIEESDSFGELDIEAGLPDPLTSGNSSASPDAAPQFTFSDSPTGAPASADPTFGASDPSAAPTAAAVAALTDTVNSLALPKPGDSPAVGSPDFTKNYPKTGTADLSLPDPRTVDLGPTQDAASGNRAASWNPDVENLDTPPSAESIGPSGLTLPSAIPSLAPSTTPAASESGQGNLGLANALQTADRQFAAEQPAEALATLSLFYHSPGLTEAERTALLSRLDPLAAIVIYSRRHLLETPHRVGPTETLMEVASRYELPWQLLANINAIEDPVTVLPGTELKVVRGPFRAEVDLTRNELTIFLGELYAGRFPIKVGAEPAPQEGSFNVIDKQNAQTFYDRDGSPIPPDDPRNPYGNVWISLGQQLCIHGSPDPSQPSNVGCISLRSADANDLFGILGQGSSVTIRR